MDKWPQDYPQDGWTDYRHYVTPRSLNDWNVNERAERIKAWVIGAALAAIIFLALIEWNVK